MDELVDEDADLTGLPGVGEASGTAIRNIALTGTLGKPEKTAILGELGSRQH